MVSRGVKRNKSLLSMDNLEIEEDEDEKENSSSSSSKSSNYRQKKAESNKSENSSKLSEDSTLVKLKSKRKSDDQAQLWIAGCSVTAGVGVNPDQRFAVLIAENFGGQFVDLAKGGSSIEFATDQILRSNIRNGDWVIWGLTSEYRALIWDRKSDQDASFTSYTFDYKRTNKADDVVDETRLYKAVISYSQVENFCKKVGAHLIAVPIICSEALQLLLHDHDSYYQLPYMHVF